MRPGSATSQDFGWGIREATSNVNSWVQAPGYRPTRYSEVYGKPSTYSDQTTVGAPWKWWKSGEMEHESVLNSATVDHRGR